MSTRVLVTVQSLLRRFFPSVTTSSRGARSDDRDGDSRAAPSAGALLPIAPGNSLGRDGHKPIDGFFADKARAFWYLQIAGWIGALGLRVPTALANGQPASYLVPAIISTITGFSLTLIMSVLYRSVIDRRPIVTWTASLSVLVIASALYSFIDGWVFQSLRDTNTDFSILSIGAFFLDATLLGAWSALYFAINYFLRIEEQADQLVVLEAQATSAQLAMLRYQLNPHFLFNTLNSISTLVLLRQTEPANAMLSRLSAFLRYTLANEPTGEVTLAQEVETLKLYLDIEKMRFEERLRPHFDIDPSVADARVPSLILQPLVENAIKYAVTPKEDGADILVAAQRRDDTLWIEVTDSGPGLNIGDTQPTLASPNLSTGVGLANIRDRLAQAYGDRQRFTTKSIPGGGFSVTLELPFTAEDSPNQEARPFA